MARACQQSCKFGAISMGRDRAYIDPDKCKECGMCARNCPYNAIADLIRPCKKACPVGAITMDEETGICLIDDSKCIRCGKCIHRCPFGAIGSKTAIVDVIKSIIPGKQVFAMFTPAMEGEFGADITMESIRTACKKIGFTDMYEVGLGADMTAASEAAEWAEAYAGLPTDDGRDKVHQSGDGGQASAVRSGDLAGRQARLQDDQPSGVCYGGCAGKRDGQALRSDPCRSEQLHSGRHDQQQSGQEQAHSAAAERDGAGFEAPVRRPQRKPDRADGGADHAGRARKSYTLGWKRCKPCACGDGLHDAAPAGAAQRGLYDRSGKASRSVSCHHLQEIVRGKREK